MFSRCGSRSGSQCLGCTGLHCSWLNWHEYVITTRMIWNVEMTVQRIRGIACRFMWYGHLYGRKDESMGILCIWRRITYEKFNWITCFINKRRPYYGGNTFQFNGTMYTFLSTNFEKSIATRLLFSRVSYHNVCNLLCWSASLKSHYATM